MAEHPTVTVKQALAALKVAGNKEDARILQRYFKTGQGEYAEGDRFLGVRVPATRRLLRRFRGLTLAQTTQLLRSPWHEARLLALLILIDQYRRGDAASRAAIEMLYLDNTRHINNWDLVDLSARHIVGPRAAANSALLIRLATSTSLWERRIAIMATGYSISRGDFEPTLCAAELLLDDTCDLIHKAVGWMLREVGKRDRAAEERFLKTYYHRMPRTMLRYAIEKFPEQLRQRYLKGRLARPP